MGDVAQGIKAFKKGMQDDDKTAEKPESVKTIDYTTMPPPTEARSDVGSKVVWTTVFAAKISLPTPTLPTKDSGLTFGG